MLLACKTHLLLTIANWLHPLHLMKIKHTWNIWFLMHFIGFHLNVLFYLLIILYKMFERCKKQSLDSCLFHHGLIKILLVHCLQTLGDDWDGLLIWNNVVTTIHVETLVMDKPMIEKCLDFSSGKQEF